MPAGFGCCPFLCGGSVVADSLFKLLPLFVQVLCLMVLVLLFSTYSVLSRFAITKKYTTCKFPEGPFFRLFVAPLQEALGRLFLSDDTLHKLGSYVPMKSGLLTLL